MQPHGNAVVQELMPRVSEPRDADWRGLGMIPGSGPGLRVEVADWDAAVRFPVDAGESLEPAGCRCGEVQRGLTDPADCAFFGRRRTPEEPVGACMVSGEGAGAARGELHVRTTVESDCAPLWDPLEAALVAAGPELRFLRDPTRGGLTTVLAEPAEESGLGREVEEDAFPVAPGVRSRG